MITIDFDSVRFGKLKNQLLPVINDMDSTSLEIVRLFSVMRFDFSEMRRILLENGFSSYDVDILFHDLFSSLPSVNSACLDRPHRSMRPARQNKTVKEMI